MRSYRFVVERDPETNLLVGYVPGWPGAHTHGADLDELQQNLRHPDGRSTTVPFHAGRDVSPTLLRKIAADVRLTVGELLGVR